MGIYERREKKLKILRSRTNWVGSVVCAAPRTAGERNDSRPIGKHFNFRAWVLRVYKKN